MFAGAAIGVEYNVKRVRVNFQDFDKDLKDAQVYVVSHGVEKLCGRINQNQVRLLGIGFKISLLYNPLNSLYQD